MGPRVGGRGPRLVGVKGELSLASPNPQRGFGLARDSLGRFFGPVGDECWGWEGTAEGAKGRWVRGGGVGLGRGRLDRPLRKARNQRGRSVTDGASRRRWRMSMKAPRRDVR